MHARNRSASGWFIESCAWEKQGFIWVDSELLEEKVGSISAKGGSCWRRPKAWRPTRPHPWPFVASGCSPSTDARDETVDLHLPCPCCGGRMIVIKVFARWR